MNPTIVRRHVHPRAIHTGGAAVSGIASSAVFFIFGGLGIGLLIKGSPLAGIGLMGIALFGGALLEKT